MSIIPDFSVEELADFLSYGISKLNEAGITTVHTDDLQTLPCSFDKVIGAYKLLEDKGELNARIVELCFFYHESEFKRFLDLVYKTQTDSEDLFRIGPRKLLQDGSLGPRTAAMRERYEDEDCMGEVTFDQETLNRYVLESQRNGMGVAIHGIGDKAIEMNIEAFENVLKEDPENKLRHGVVHVQITDDELIERMGKAYMQGFIQPIFIDYDVNIVFDRFGQERASKSYA